MTIFVAAALLLTLSPAPTPTPADIFGQQELYSLRHLSRIIVEVHSERADSDVQAWVTQTKLKESTEAKLREGGLTVVGAKEWAEANLRIPIFQILIYTQKVPAGGHAYAVNVFLQEGVMVLRDEATPLAATWTATNIRYLSAPSAWKRIAEDIDGAVALFLADVRKARSLYGKMK